MSSFGRHFVLALTLLAAPVMLSACADLPKTQSDKAEYDVTNDPIEPFNRVVFDVNDFLDRLLLRPLAELYRATIPPGIRDRVAGVVTNMREPVIFMNNVLQGEITRAGMTLERFAMNTTLGVGGMWDVAGSWRGVYQQTGDFGQTLAVWGMGEGPYLVLPLYGPSNIRDGIGLGVDMAASPWQYLAEIDGSGTRDRFNISSFVASGIVRREQNIEAIDALREGSLDFYAQMRSVYRQYRAKQLGHQSTDSMPVFQDYQ